MRIAISASRKNTQSCTLLLISIRLYGGSRNLKFLQPLSTHSKLQSVSVQSQEVRFSKLLHLPVKLCGDSRNLNALLLQLCFPKAAVLNFADFLKLCFK